ncbi:MAG: S-layer homology domain-containing protein [Peptostreptococcaceae bacterium]|nr:S-layer homology domain-containing protein [Peptostreptococcaceae bacterium]
MESMERNKNFRKSIAFTLIMAMLMSMISFGAGSFGGGVYATTDGTATVRIIDENNNTVITNAAVSIENGVTTLGAVVASACQAENRTFELGSNGFPATVGGVILGTGFSWMSMLNDSGSAFNTGNFTDITVNDGDSIVLYADSWPSVISYSYFEAGNPSRTESGNYYKANVPLTLHQLSFTDPKTIVEGATVTAIETTYGTTYISTTDINGKATLNLWAGTYLISAEKLSGSAMVITKPYAKVIVGDDGSATIISPKTPDVNLEKLEIQLPVLTVNMKKQLDAGNPHINTTEVFTGVTISAIASSETATMSVSQGGDTTNLTSGTAIYLSDSAVGASNTFILKVENGEFSKNYTFYINKVAAAVTDSALITEVKAVIGATSDKGITYYDTYYPEYVTALYSNGGTLTDSGKAKFLSEVMDDVRSNNAVTSVGRLGKIAAALTAIGIDPRQVPDISTNVASGTAIDLIEKISEYSVTKSGIYNAPYMLIGYDSGNYTVASGTDRSELINYMLGQQNINGGFSISWPDTDTTALNIMALAPYYNSNGPLNGVSAGTVSKIKISVDNALTYLQSQQNNFGRFTGYYNYTNSNSTSLVVSALSAINKNAHADSYIKNNYSAVQGLLSYKTSEGLVGITDSIKSNNVSDVQGMMALVGYIKYLENGDGNIYKFSNQPEIYDNWPSEILKEINVERTSKIFKAGGELSADDITVSGIFSSSSGTRSAIILPGEATTGYSITGNTNLKAGGNSITVSYLGKTSTFILTALNNDGTIAPVATVNISVKDGNNKTIAEQRNDPIESGKTTVIDSLRSLLDSKNITYRISGGTYVSSINGISEFDGGAFSGWLYKVNGVTLPTTAAGDKTLTGGENVVWYYTLDFTKDASSSSWVAENAVVGGSGNTVSVSTELSSKLDSKLKAAAAVSATELSAAIKKAVDGLTGDNAGKQTEIKINVDLDDKAVSLDTTIPKTSFGNLVTNKIGTLTIASAIGDISLDLNTLKTIFGEATGDISISITNAEKTVGRPTIDLSIMSNGKKITKFGGVVTVTIPYTLASGETASSIKVYYINEEGKQLDVKSSSYDEKSGMVTFQTDHFSQFVIAYKNMTFADIQGHWAQAYIELLANRGIINGMTETTFVPNGNITRAQFAMLLAGLEGADLSQYNTSQFNDVSQNAWYLGAVAWASDNNITLGYTNIDGSKSFNPNQNITRQDMAVMMKRYLDQVANKTLTESDAKIDFTDDNIIADYAKDAVMQLQLAGIVNGKITQAGKTEFDPTGKLTRAEAAKIIVSI